MITPKNIFIVLGVLFSLYVGYLFVNSLEPPKHIHSRDDVPQKSSNSSEDVAAAVQSLEKQVQENPENFQILLSLGHAYLGNRNYRKAAETFARAVKVNPGSAEAHTDLGVALGNGGQVEEALKQLKKVTAEFPDYADGWLQLGSIYRFRLKQNRQALECFQKFLLLDGKSEIAPQVRNEIKQIESELKP